MMFLKAVSAARLEGIVTTNLSLYLSAHDTNSYPGSGSTWTDLSTNANNATLYNSPTFLTDNGGILDFDGVNDYGDGTTATGTPWAFGSGAFTVEQWVKWDSTTSGYRTAAIDARNRNLALSQSVNFGFADYINASNKYTVFRAVSDVFVSNASISGATWYHIVYSRNSTATNDARLYINNVLDKTATQSQTWSDYGSYYIGRIINATPVYFDGKLAQLRVYKGKALTAAQVTRNWNAHRRLYGL